MSVIDSLAVIPEGNWGLKFPLSAEQWFLQIQDRIPRVFNEHARIVFVAANYEEYCRTFTMHASTVPFDEQTLYVRIESVFQELLAEEDEGAEHTLRSMTDKMMAALREFAVVRTPRMTGAIKEPIRNASVGRHNDSEGCPDCEAAARHANSDATTPGFFHDKCEKHRLEVGKCKWCDEGNSRVVSSVDPEGQTFVHHTSVGRVLCSRKGA